MTQTQTPAPLSATDRPVTFHRATIKSDGHTLTIKGRGWGTNCELCGPKVRGYCYTLTGEGAYMIQCHRCLQWALTMSNESGDEFYTPAGE